jgi:hypothetical protein
LAKDWNELTKAEQETIRLMLMSLKEFSYGFDAADTTSNEVEPGAAKLRFYITALYYYFSSYFLVGGPNKLRNSLEQLGCGDLLEPIDELLNFELDDMKVSEIMLTWRDKFLTHQTFSFKVLDKNIYNRVDLLKQDKGELYSGIVRELFRRTKKLYVNFVLKYPEVLTG